MPWCYKIIKDSGNALTSKRKFNTSTSARKAAHNRLHKKDIPIGSYSEVSKCASKKRGRK